MHLREAIAEDLPLLAELNRQLIQDQRSPNPMSVAELEERMRGWLVAELNGEPASASPLARYFVEAGFAATSGGLQLRVPRLPSAAAADA